MSIAGIPVGLLVCSANRSPLNGGWGDIYHDPRVWLFGLRHRKAAMKAERVQAGGMWWGPWLAEFTPEKQNPWAVLSMWTSFPLIYHFGYQQTLGLELTFYEVVEGSKGEVVTRRCRCWISPRVALTDLVLSLCWHVMSPTKPCVLSVESAQPKRTWFIFFHKKLVLIPIWKKSTFVFLPCFNLKKKSMFTSIYPIATYGSDIYLWIPHTPADLCRQGSWPELFNYFPLGLLNWGRPSAQYLHFLWAKHLWNGTKHAKGIRENFVFLYTIDKKCLTFREFTYYIYIFLIPGHGRETQKHHSCHFGWLIPL